MIASASGCGKTTFARELARRLDVPFVELDALHWGPAWTEASVEELRAQVEPIVARDAWVIDGGYMGKLGHLVVGSADVVVWLDFAPWIWLPRLARRSWRRLRGHEPLWNENKESLRDLVWGRESLFGHALRNYRRRRRLYPERLGAYTLVRLRRPADAARFLEEAAA